MKNFFAIVCCCAALVAASQLALAGEDVYKPYHECMTRCSNDLYSCRDNISSRADDQAGREQACAEANADCTQECQFLPIPGEDGSAPTPTPKPE